MQMVCMEVVVPMVHMVMVANSEVVVEMYMVIGVERIVAYSQMEMMMRVNMVMVVIVDIIEIAKVIVAIVRSHEPVHMEPTYINDNTGTIADCSPAHNNWRKQDSTRWHVIVPIPVNEDITAWCPNPM